MAARPETGRQSRKHRFSPGVRVQREEVELLDVPPRTALSFAATDDSDAREATPDSTPPPPAAPGMQRISVGSEPPCSCRRLRAGVRVRCERFDRWARRCNIKNVEGQGRYATLLEKAEQGAPWVDDQTRRQVLLDVERSCPALSFFQGGGGRRMLINMLFAWVVHDGRTPEDQEPTESSSGEVVESGDGTRCHVPVGYVQGMSFIAMNLLWHAGREEAAFWVFAAMMQRYDLRTMFEPPDMRGLQMRVFTVAQLLQYTMPELSKHLAEYLNNSLGLILTDSLLTLFASSMALGPLAELWDRFFSAGYGIVYCLILARLRCLEPWLLKEKDFTRLAHLVRSVHVNFDRVDGILAPRLRNWLPPGERASGNSAGGGSAGGAGTSSGGSSERSKHGLLQRVVFGAAALVTAPRHRNNGSSAGHSGADDKVVEDSVNNSRSGAAAWTCQECNGSEDCVSWLALVTELAEAEKLDADVISRFEQIFGDGDHIFPTRADYRGPPSTSTNSTPAAASGTASASRGEASAATGTASASRGEASGSEAAAEVTSETAAGEAAAAQEAAPVQTAAAAESAEAAPVVATAAEGTATEPAAPAGSTEPEDGSGSPESPNSCRRCASLLLETRQLSAGHAELLAQIAELRAENATLRKERDDARAAYANVLSQQV